MAMISDSGRTQAVINMTPMIDVLLVLLIIFMAITPMQPTGLNAALPRNAGSAGKPEPEAPILLEIAEDGAYRINSEKVDHASLHGRLVAVFARRGERVLFVKAASALEFGVVAAAIDTAHGANVDRVALMQRQ
jgi:biopolymer transport protein ExbD